MKSSVVGKSIYVYVVLCSPFDTMDTFVVFSQEFGAHRADDLSGQGAVVPLFYLFIHAYGI
jgi:hypothetical protein